MVAGPPATNLFNLMNCEYSMKRLLVIAPFALMVACAERPAEDYRHDLLDLAFSAVGRKKIRKVAVSPSGSGTLRKEISS